MDKWQPMETAPRDGTLIRLLHRDNSVRRARWDYRAKGKTWRYECPVQGVASGSDLLFNGWAPDTDTLANSKPGECE